MNFCRGAACSLRCTIVPASGALCSCHHSLSQPASLRCTHPAPIPCSPAPLHSPISLRLPAYLRARLPTLACTLLAIYCRRALPPLSSSAVVCTLVRTLLTIYCSSVLPPLSSSAVFCFAQTPRGPTSSCVPPHLHASTHMLATGAAQAPVQQQTCTP